MIENPYDLLKLFYKIEKEYKAILPVGGSALGDRSIIDSTISSRCISRKEEIYCPKCGDIRRYELRVAFDNTYIHKDIEPSPSKSIESILERCKNTYDGNDFEEFKKYVYKNIILHRVATLIIGRCLQCENDVNIIIYNENDDISMVKLFKFGSGVATEHTPESVKYYLDEAYKCKTMGAYTGAVAMYRTALENLLYNKGYQKGMLKDKIEAFEKDKKNGTAQRWADAVDEDILDKIRDLGNWAVHPNKGDITKQQHLQDEELIECLDEIFKYMLDEIYEKEINRNSLLDKLKKKKQDLHSNK